VLESLETRSLMAIDSLICSTEVLTELRADPQFIERMRFADLDQNGRFSTSDILLATTTNGDIFNESLGVLEDWIHDIEPALLQRKLETNGIRSGQAVAQGENGPFPAGHWTILNPKGYETYRPLGPDWGFDIDVATILDNAPIGVVPENVDGGWIPVNDDDDNNDNVADSQRTNPGTAQPYEYDLLPIVVRSETAFVGGKYTIGWDTTNFKIWESKDCTAEVTSTQEFSFTIDRVFYVECVGRQGSTFSDFILYAHRAASGGTPAINGQLVDVVRINTFKISGPWAVPWGGVYDYTADNGVAPSGGSGSSGGGGGMGGGAGVGGPPPAAGSFLPPAPGDGSSLSTSYDALVHQS
jgi:hypothetical protein